MQILSYLFRVFLRAINQYAAVLSKKFLDQANFELQVRAEGSFHPSQFCTLFPESQKGTAIDCNGHNFTRISGDFYHFIKQTDIFLLICERMP